MPEPTLVKWNEETILEHLKTNRSRSAQPDAGTDRVDRPQVSVDGCAATGFAGAGGAGHDHRTGFRLRLRPRAVAATRDRAGSGADDRQPGLPAGAAGMSALTLKGATLPEILLNLETCTRWGARFVRPPKRLRFIRIRTCCGARSRPPPVCRRAGCSGATAWR